jgi:hypothetical protein
MSDSLRSQAHLARARRRSGTEGSASLELVGALPLVALSLLCAFQLGIAGYVLWSAGTAARAGARAVLIGREPGAAARGSLPGILVERSRVSRKNGVTVAVRLPGLVPGLPETWLEGSSDLGR